VGLVLAGVACSVPGGHSGGGQTSALPGYRWVRDVPLPGGTTRFDYQAFDSPAQRLYIAHQGDGVLVVFDTRNQRVLTVVPDVQQAHGVEVAPGLGRIYVTATGNGELAVVDATTFRIVARAPAGDFPDGLAYAPQAGKVFVSDLRGTGDTIIDARTGQPVGHVELGSDIGNSKYDPATGRIVVAVGGDNHLALIDPATAQVVGSYPLPGCDGAHGVQVDEAANRRVFVACENNAKLVTFDLDSKQASVVADVGDTPDVLALDPGLHRLYVAAESGVVSVFDVAGTTIRKLAQAGPGPDAHSVAVDPATHLVYLPLTDVGGRPVLRELAPT
jgi:DNA-binding beta-propeller fold protein YncE